MAEATAPTQILVFDIVGPFAIQFLKGTNGETGTANIYAPFCENHHANLLTDTQDIPLFGLDPPPAPDKPYPDEYGYVYCFEPGTAPTGKSTYEIEAADAMQLLLVESKDVPPKRGMCHLMFQVPCPDNIVPLRSEPIWIHQYTAQKWVKNPDYYEGESKGKSKMVFKPRARAIRFIYTQCKVEPVVVCMGGVKKLPIPNLGGISMLTRGLPTQSGLHHYNLTLRFTSSQPSDGQEDAYRCFRTMRKLFPDTANWRVDFEHREAQRDESHKMELLQRGGKHPSDCGAAVLVLQDW